MINHYNVFEHLVGIQHVGGIFKILSSGNKVQILCLFLHFCSSLSFPSWLFCLLFLISTFFCFRYRESKGKVRAGKTCGNFFLNAIWCTMATNSWPSSFHFRKQLFFSAMVSVEDCLTLNTYRYVIAYDVFVVCLSVVGLPNAVTHVFWLNRGLRGRRTTIILLDGAMTSFYRLPIVTRPSLFAAVWPQFWMQSFCLLPSTTRAQLPYRYLNVDCSVR